MSCRMPAGPTGALPEGRSRADASDHAVVSGAYLLAGHRARRARDQRNGQDGTPTQPPSGLVQPREKPVDGKPTHFVTVLVDHGHAGFSAAAVGKSPKPTNPMSLRRNACSDDTRAMVQRAFEENTALGGSGAASMRRSSAVKVGVSTAAHVHQIAAARQSRLVQRVLPALQPQQPGHCVVAHERDAAVPVRNQMPGCLVPATDVVLQDGIGGQPAGSRSANTSGVRFCHGLR